MSGNSHKVEFLPLHLQDRQQVIFEEGHHRHAVEHGPPVTKLTAYFELKNSTNLTPEQNTILDNLKYNDLPKHFLWKSKNWKLRKNRVPVDTGVPLENKCKPVVRNLIPVPPKKNGIIFHEIIVTTQDQTKKLPSSKN
jgi:hypothetical protein